MDPKTLTILKVIAHYLELVLGLCCFVIAFLAFFYTGLPFVVQIGIGNVLLITVSGLVPIGHLLLKGIINPFVILHVFFFMVLPCIAGLVLIYHYIVESTKPDLIIPKWAQKLLSNMIYWDGEEYTRDEFLGLLMAGQIRGFEIIRSKPPLKA